MTARRSSRAVVPALRRWPCPWPPARWPGSVAGPAARRHRRSRCTVGAATIATPGSHGGRCPRAVGRPRSPSPPGQRRLLGRHRHRRLPRLQLPGAEGYRRSPPDLHRPTSVARASASSTTPAPTTGRSTPPSAPARSSASPTTSSGPLWSDGRWRRAPLTLCDGRRRGVGGRSACADTHGTLTDNWNTESPSRPAARPNGFVWTVGPDGGHRDRPPTARPPRAVVAPTTAPTAQRPPGPRPPPRRRPRARHRPSAGPTAGGTTGTGRPAPAHRHRLRWTRRAGVAGCRSPRASACWPSAWPSCCSGGAIVGCAGPVDGGPVDPHGDRPRSGDAPRSPTPAPRAGPRPRTPARAGSPSCRPFDATGHPGEPCRLRRRCDPSACSRCAAPWSWWPLLAIGLVVQLALVSRLEHRSAQVSLYNQFRTELALGTAPLGPGSRRHLLPRARRWP